MAGADVAANNGAVGEQHRGLPTCDLRHEKATLVDRVLEFFPDCPQDVAIHLVDDAFARLSTAKVQTFRSILAERAVREHLQAATDAVPLTLTLQAS